ncbi:hypothetical protein AB0N17_03185 [Streptomyces sp. NPDC051133]|uniref:hypothetical protein n=1 Tax=Streptomyces sp. NPDC051133 TaxID=3155521 RepID=UPI00342FE2EA
MILHDAATAWLDLINAAVLWVETFAAAAAFTLCVVGFCLGPLIAPAARTVCRAVVLPAAPARRRPVPSWAHTEPYDYDEAA